MDDTQEPQAKKLKLEDTTLKPECDRRLPLIESDVGIKCYITSGFTPIPGIVKQRFSDFIVNEMDMAGKIVQLTNTEVETIPAANGSLPSTKKSTCSATNNLPTDSNKVNDNCNTVTDSSTAVTDSSTAVTNSSPAVTNSSTVVTVSSTTITDSSGTVDGNSATKSLSPVAGTHEVGSDNSSAELADSSSITDNSSLVDSGKSITENCSTVTGSSKASTEDSEKVANTSTASTSSASNSNSSNSQSTILENSSQSKSCSAMDTGHVNCPIPTNILNELKEIKKKKSVKMVAPQEKDARKKIHYYIQAQFPNICSNCITDNGVKYLEFSLQSDNSSSDPRNRGEGWPKDRPTHLHFILYKEFKDTMEAIDIISKYSGIKPQHFNYAGTKDRRAKTSQRISAHKVKAEKLQAINSKLRGIAMGNFQYSNERVTLGQLSGNRFKIVLRSVETTSENLEKATESLRQLGFINYFGMQRFGTASIPTYQVGLHILKGEFDKAVDLIMVPRSTDKPHISEVRQIWMEKKDAKVVLKKLPKSMNIERRLMEGVVTCGVTNLSGALERIPRTTRLLYLHSYQSLVWNKVASLRVEKYGLKPMVGDLVYIQEPRADDMTVDEDETTSSSDKKTKPTVKHLTEDELEKYTIYDIVLPLPGYDVVLPANELKDAVTGLLAEDSLSLESLKCTKKAKQYRLPGSYRHVMVKPIDLTSSLSYYDDVTEELVQSDMDLLNKQELKHKNSGKHMAAILEFGLPSSCYATMLLREITRADTSAAHQTSLNKQ